jgi:hypothetical protein
MNPPRRIRAPEIAVLPVSSEEAHCCLWWCVSTTGQTKQTMIALVDATTTRLRGPSIHVSLETHYLTFLSEQQQNGARRMGPRTRWGALLLRYRREGTLGGLLLVVQMVSFLQCWVLMGRSTTAGAAGDHPPQLLSSSSTSTSVERQFSNDNNAASSSRQLSTARSNDTTFFISPTAIQQWLSMAAATNSSSSSSLLLPPDTPGAFLHLAKTGGSTLSHLLRHGCHSTVLPKPCRNITAELQHQQQQQQPQPQQQRESYLSLLSTYYHIPDFAKLVNNYTHYAFYTLTLRDPLDRTLSSLVYTHPSNQAVLGNHVRYRHRQFYKPCFRDLDDFAAALHSFQADRPNRNPPCVNKAHRALHNQAQWVEHLYYDAKYMTSVIPAGRPILVIRMEHLADDWRSANRALGQDDTTLSPPQQQLRQIDQHQRLPVGRDNLRDESRRYLCEALLDEYQAYLALVWQAINLQERDRWEVYDRARQHCPELNATLPSLQQLDRRFGRAS